MIMAKDALSSAAKPLAEMPMRSSCRVAKVLGPERCRLSEMGLIEGAQVTVVNKSCGDMMVVKIGGCRLALARGMPGCVMVR